MPDCSGCGSYIPEGQGSLCSMCFGDPCHGSDGYYQEYLDRQQRLEYEKQEYIRNCEEQNE